MAQHRTATSRRVRRSSPIEPKAGGRVRVLFGRHESLGTIVGETVTGRYTVRVEVDGADGAVTTSYAPEDIRTLEESALTVAPQTRTATE